MHLICHIISFILLEKCAFQIFNVGFASKQIQYINICSGVAGRGSPGVWTPPPEPSEATHANRVNPVRNFFVVGVGGLEVLHYVTIGLLVVTE